MLVALKRLFPSDDILTKGLQCFLDRWIFAQTCNAMLHLALLAVQMIRKSARALRAASTASWKLRPQ
jgi:hypothetical protein